MYYIHETDKPRKILRKLNIIRLIDNKIALPINNEKITQRQAEKLALKTKKILNKTNCNKVVVSKKIKSKEQYIDYLNSYNINIIDGRWLFEVLIYDVLQYIMKVKEMKKEEIRYSYNN